MPVVPGDPRAREAVAAARLPVSSCAESQDPRTG